MDAIGLQKDYGYHPQKNAAYSKSGTVGTGNGTFWQHGRILSEDHFTKTGKMPESERARAAESDKTMLLSYQSRLDNMRFSGRMNQESGTGTDICHEAALSKNQEAGQIQRKEKENGTTDKSKKSFNGLDILGPSAPDEVKEAWNNAEKVSGVNGYGMNSEGMLTGLTKLFVMSMENVISGGGRDVLGSTVHSAKAAVQRALDRLGIPQNDEEKKEKLFYEAFLSFLG